MSVQDETEEFEESKDFFLEKEGNSFIFKVGLSKNKKNVVFISREIDNKTLNSYKAKFTLINLQEKLDLFYSVRSLEEAYLLIVNEFDSKDNAHIAEIEKEHLLKLSLKIIEIEMIIDMPFEKGKEKMNKSKEKQNTIENINENKNEIIDDCPLPEKFVKTRNENEILKKENELLKKALAESTVSDENIKDLLNQNEKLIKEVLALRGSKEDENKSSEEDNNSSESNDELNQNNNCGNEGANYHNIDNMDPNVPAFRHKAIKKTIVNGSQNIGNNNSNSKSRKSAFFTNDIFSFNINKDNKENNPAKKEEPNLKLSKTITQSAYISYSLDNTFAAFCSISQEIFIVFGKKDYSLACFDLLQLKYSKFIPNAHKSLIISIRHYLNKKEKKDYLLSGSIGDNCVKVWDFEDWACICNIPNAYSKSDMFSFCILFDELDDNNYILTSSLTECIKIWNFKGESIKTIKNSNNETYFIDSFLDKNNKNYIITCNKKYVKSYDFKSRKEFNVYNDSNSCCEHISAIIYDKNDVKLIESEFYGVIRIWNFHSANLLKKLEICKGRPLVGLCLWNDNYLFTSCVDQTIKLIDLQNYKMKKSFPGHNDEVCTIKKVYHPKYGDILLSQGLANDQIRMWVDSDNE